jgi:hypothetical protein
MKQAKRSKMSRKEILAGIGWRPLKMPGVPAAVAKAENKRQADYLVSWVRGLAAHIEKVDAAKCAQRRTKTAGSAARKTVRKRG